MPGKVTAKAPKSHHGNVCGRFGFPGINAMVAASQKDIQPGRNDVSPRFLRRGTRLLNDVPFLVAGTLFFRTPSSSRSLVSSSRIGLRTLDAPRPLLDVDVPSSVAL